MSQNAVSIQVFVWIVVILAGAQVELHAGSTSKANSDRNDNRRTSNHSQGKKQPKAEPKQQAPRAEPKFDSPGAFHGHWVYAAGVPEFWRIDARGVLSFEILRLTANGYAPTQLPDGWWHSDVFGRDFRMTQSTNPPGQPKFTLDVR